MTTQLLVIGIDGASHAITSRLISESRLPHMARLGERGVSGVLSSTFPPHTAPGWASLFTGVLPGKHGVFQFWETKSAAYQPTPVMASRYGREPLWRLLEHAGLRVGVINVPMTHPPVRLAEGYMISWPLAPTLHYSEPADLVGELRRANLHFHSDLVTMYRGQEDYLAEAADHIRRRVETIFYLQRTRPMDALLVVFTELDRVSHHYWGSAEEPASQVLEAYQWMDDAVGQLLSLADDETLVMVVSDHGFGRCSYNLNVHRLLEQAGLLAVRFVPGPAAATAGAADGDWASPNGASWFQSSTLFRAEVDWSGTAVYMPTPGCFGLNFNLAGREAEGALAPGDVRGAEEKVRALFEDLRTPDGVRRPFSVVRGADAYHGPRASDAPDLILMPGDWSVMPHPGLEAGIWGPPTQDAIHRMDGILFAVGADLPRGEAVEAAIEDVTPTILAHLGLPVPDDLDGRWLGRPDRPVAREPARPASGDACRMLTREEQRQLEQRLSQLGYL